MNRTSVLAALEAHLLQSLERAQSQVASLQESLTSESKSTAGDKHETGRAMIQQALEQAVLAQNRASEHLVGFRKITAGSPSQVVAPGSLVYTTKGWFFIGMALGKVPVAERHVFGVSLASPVGQALKGAAAGDLVPFQAGKIEVLEVQ